MRGTATRPHGEKTGRVAAIGGSAEGDAVDLDWAFSADPLLRPGSGASTDSVTTSHPGGLIAGTATSGGGNASATQSGGAAGAVTATIYPRGC